MLTNGKREGGDCEREGLRDLRRAEERLRLTRSREADGRRGDRERLDRR